MKRYLYIFAALTLAATLSAAQSSEPSRGATAPAAQSQQQSAPQPGAQGQQPAQSAPAQQAPGKKRPEAKTQEEFQAFQQAQASQTPDALEKAAADFATKYPQSELRTLLFSRAMMMYQQQNNPDKLIDMARKVIAIDPTDAVSNVFLATFLPERVRESDLDRDEKFAESTKAADTALANVDNLSADAPADKVEANKNLIRSMAYSAKGTIALNKKDYATAEQDLKKGIDAGKEVNSDPVMYLRYSVALDNQKKYQEALAAANKAIELSPPGSAYYNLANQEKQRLTQLMGTNPGAAKPAATTPPTPQTQPTTPQTNPSTPK